MKKKNWFVKMILVLFVIYLGLYIASVSGFSDSSIRNKVTLTDEAIKQFERDVMEGKNVDLNKYVKTENVDYSNKLTDAGEAFSSVFEKVLSDGLGGAWDAIKVLFF